MMSMKKIARHFFYTVYDLDNGRVLKKENSHLRKLWKHIFWNGKGMSYIRQSLEDSRMLAQHISDPSIIANPVFTVGFDYEQDKVQEVFGYLKTHSFAENKILIDQYVAHIYTTWKHGFSDVIFNMTHNCGVDAKGNLVLLDFNEITFSKDKIRIQIIKKKWLHSWSYHYLRRDKPLSLYYREKMNDSMTLSKLEEFCQDGAYV